MRMIFQCCLNLEYRYLFILYLQMTQLFYVKAGAINHYFILMRFMVVQKFSKDLRIELISFNLSSFDKSC